MTCIVGMVDGGKVFMGADSLATNHYVQTPRKDAKLFRNKHLLIGYCGSPRMGQLLRFKLEPPEIPAGKDVFNYACTDLVDAVIKTLKDNGFAKEDNNVLEGGTFLLGVAGRLFRIDSDFQVAESLYSYDACGSGAEVALGSLHSTTSFTSSEKRLKLALEAASAHTPYVQSPYLIEVLE